MSFDVLVVGRGLLGSAAARHLATENSNVALIGPTEEQCLLSKKVFARKPATAAIPRTARAIAGNINIDRA